MHAKREERARNPIKALWHRHRWNAKQRGIEVIWTYSQFYDFCERTGYLEAVKVGMTIERKNCLIGYRLSNCILLTHAANSEKGWSVDRWLKDKIAKRRSA